MVVPQRTIASAYAPNCAAQGGAVSAGNCLTNLSPSLLFNYTLSDIDYYNNVNAAAKVRWKIGYSPNIAAAKTYPNTIFTIATFAAVVNCTDAYESIFRIGWRYGAFNGPCVTDPIYSVTRCFAAGTATVSSSWLDSSNQPTTAGTRFKSLLCPSEP